MKIVYGIHEGCIYEGGGCHNTVYASLPLAREAALKVVSEKQKRLLQMREWSKNNGGLDDDTYSEDWREEQPNYWRGVHDVVMVQKFKFVTDEKEQ